ncbi:glycosyltransferase family 39 protein [Enterococcus saccharolyticus]|uniref:glycosyltransferase family 39 protein n=2 Tax=Enterococcus TaxID=1350 RepID=UPI001E3E7E52|nr:glycosyltransferase family 39 protein [Enterococcus saccharolyticus]MCD5003728.1 glycosyltransferase family 39 protein [Enterococcus saccharolyticus]
MERKEKMKQYSRKGLKEKKVLNKKSNFFYDLIDYLYFIIIILMIFGAVRSKNFNVENLSNSFWGIVLVILIGILIFNFKPSFKKWGQEWFKAFNNLFIDRIGRISLSLFVLAILLQIVILLNVSMPIGWDVGTLYRGVNTFPNSNPWISVYLSENPNNSLFFFLMYGYKMVLGFFKIDSTWLTWQLLNIVLLDLGIVLIFKATYRIFGKTIAYVATYLTSMSLMFSPWILVPYTDIIIIPVIALIMFLYSKIKVDSINLKELILLGFFITVSYLLKPSSVVFLIAWFLISLIRVGMKETANLKQNTIKILICISVILLTFFGFNFFKSHQKAISYDDNKAKPWTHFVMMGLNGDGGYSREDSEKTKSLGTQEEKKDYTIKIIKERLNQFGLLGYTKFLVYKFFKFSSDGDFGWGYDGQQQQFSTKSKNKLQTMLRDFYSQDGKRTHNIRFYMQIIWMITLIGMLFAFRYNDYRDVLFKLTILGVVAYLLLFEAGRSRYLIQYIPFFFILSAFGWTKKVHTLK